MSKRIAAYESQGRSEDPHGDDDGAAGPRRNRRGPETEILFEDARCVVVAKPSGLATVPDRFRTNEPTVVDAAERLLRRRDPGAPRPLVVHRLDRDTSGALVLAKDLDAARDLTEQFEERRVAKSYLALCLGAPHPASGEVEFEVAEDPKRRGRMEIVPRRGRPCISAWDTVEVFRGLSLVRVRPLTGRTHQVRLTLLHLGTPCAIDPLYGSEAPIHLSQFKSDYRLGRWKVEAPLVDRLTLHAESLAFRSPAAEASAAPVRVEAPLPRDLATTLRQLRKWAAPGSL